VNNLSQGYVRAIDGNDELNGGVARADRLQRESVNAASTPAATLRRQSPSSRVSDRRRTFRMNYTQHTTYIHKEGKGKRSPYSITERMVPELIPVLGSQPAGDASHKPGGRLPLLSARPTVTPVTLKRAATNFAAW